MLRRGILPAALGTGRSHLPTTAPFWGKEMVKALQADAVPAFNHALARDRALDPRDRAQVEIRSRSYLTGTPLAGPERRFYCFASRLRCKKARSRTET